MHARVGNILGEYRRAIIILVVALGIIVRLLPMWNPSEGGIRLSWREGDVASIAKNYYEEGMNILYPRIDWRGEGPGFTESEFPLFAWMMAVYYNGFGINERAGRLIAFTFSVFTLFYFYALVRRLKDENAALVSLSIVAMSPMLSELATSLQPESMMLFFYLGSIYYYVSWVEDHERRYFYVSAVMISLSILFKATAAHVGLLFIIMSLKREGLKKLLLDKSMWAYAAIGILPPVLWYSHAKNLYQEYGNSLGISNETHLMGWDFFYEPYYIKGILKTEIFQVWTPLGLAIGIVFIFLIKKTSQVRYVAWWYFSIVAFYIIAARTTADGWAYYYHAYAVFPAAMMIGLAASFILENARTIYDRKLHLTYGLASSVIVVLIALLAGNKLWAIVGTSYVVVILALSLILGKKWLFKKKDFSIQGSSCVLAILLSALLIIYMAGMKNIFTVVNNKSWIVPYQCSNIFKTYIPAGAKILSSGGTCYDDFGSPVAYNASYYFYWLDRKGMNVCEQNQNLSEIEKAAARGMDYYVTERGSMKVSPSFELEMRNRYALIAECEAAYLFKLR
jgi:hypothetical protein